MNKLTTGLLATIVLGVLQSVGCVSQAQYDDALAANRRSEAAKAEEIAQKEEAYRMNNLLKGEIAKRDAIVKSKEAQIVVLENSYAQVSKNYDALKAAYEKVAGRSPLIIGQALPPELDAKLQEFAKANPDLLEYVPQYGMVKLKSDLTFASGSAEVQSAANEALAKFAQIMNSPDAAGFSVYIAGHTDDVPVSKPATKNLHHDNWYLSAHRAMSVVKLLQSSGMNPVRLGAIGFGEYHPIAPNAGNRKGNAANRRVEIWIVPAGRFLTDGGGTESTPEPIPETPAKENK